MHETNMHTHTHARGCRSGGCARTFACGPNALARAAHTRGTPMLHGAVAGFDGCVALFDSRSGPCYGCLHPEPGELTRPAVLGAVVGTHGALLATEAIRFLCGIGVDRRGQLLLTDLERGTFEWVRVPRRDDCAICGN